MVRDLLKSVVVKSNPVAQLGGRSRGASLPFCLPLQNLDGTEDLSEEELLFLVCSWRCSGVLLVSGMKALSEKTGMPFLSIFFAALRRTAICGNISAVRCTDCKKYLDLLSF